MSPELQQNRQKLHIFLSKDSLNFDRLWFSIESKIVNACQFRFFPSKISFLSNFNQVWLFSPSSSTTTTSPQLSWSKILSHFSLLKLKLLFCSHVSQFNEKKVKITRFDSLERSLRIVYVKKKNQFLSFYMGQWVWRQINNLRKQNFLLKYHDNSTRISA